MQTQIMSTLVKPSSTSSNVGAIPKQKSQEPDMGIYYSCGHCSRFFWIDKLYYCQSCQKITCKYCITQEIDSYYCPNCLENMASSESMVFKNSCKKCFQCTTCTSVLVFQAITISAEKSDFYLSCSFCHWDSLEQNLKADSPSALVAKIIDMEKDEPLQKDFTKLIEKLQKEERERAKEKRQMNRLRRPSSLIVRSSATQPSSQRTPRKTLDDIELELKAKEEIRNKFQQRRKESISDINENIEEFKQETNFSDITSLRQRFSQLSTQPTKVKELTPKRIHLLTRRSKHCASCDKLLIKPDLSPSKIEFKRQHVALMYIPRITIPFLQPIPMGTDTTVVIKLTNPVHSLMHITISKYTEYKEATAEVFTLIENTFISPRDHDEEDENAEIKALKGTDDIKAISERKSNWVMIRLPVRPLKIQPIKFMLQIGVKFKSTSGDQATNFLVLFDLGIPSL